MVGDVDGREYLDGREARKAYRPRTVQDMIDKLAEIPLLYQPGTRWHYSVSVDIQGYLIEKLSGQDLESFFREHVFEPLGMDETTGWLDERESRLLAKVHTRDESGRLELDTGFWSSDFYSPPGLFVPQGSVYQRRGPLDFLFAPQPQPQYVDPRQYEQREESSADASHHGPGEIALGVVFRGAKRVERRA